MGSAMVPLDRALLSSYRLSIVTIPQSVTVWPQPQFAMQILTGGSDPNISPFRGGLRFLSNIVLLGSWDHVSVPVKWRLIPSNGFSKMQECDRQPDGQTDRLR